MDHQLRASDTPKLARKKQKEIKKARRKADEEKGLEEQFPELEGDEHEE